MKRDIVTILWFLMGWGVGNVLFGPTEMLGLVPGIVLAGLVYWDPLHVLWSPSHRDARRVRPINEVADELDRHAGPGSSGEADRLSS